jgi:hypothetical protein
MPLHVSARGIRAFDEEFQSIVSTPVENLTVPPVENLADRRGDKPQVVVASGRSGRF